GSYISAHPDSSRMTKQRRDKKATTQPAADTLLSQSLAKIYVKQHRYDKAYEIISQLSLNYPEKSCYFADQLRFLKKLMITQQQKTTN
ncbi:MAG: tetratricopeptide repeat protein, partial [Muribaculaceae bacterium]|nr:tetratricopeptide repeat protein [Muribaculaceae bacterium]